MENGTSLDDILNSEPTEVEPQPETIGQPRDESGRFAPKEQGEEQQSKQQEPTAQDAPPASESEPSHIPMAALKDERTKRQQLEQQAQELAQKLQQYETYFQQLEQQGQPADEEPDPVAVFAAQIEQQVMSKVQQQQLLDKVNMTEVLARQKWADYDEKVELFKAEARNNPFLVKQLEQAANPAEYAYNAAQNIIAAQQYGTAQPSREQLKAELREELKAELGIGRPQAPTTLANDRSVGSRSGPAWSGPTDLGDILR